MAGRNRQVSRIYAILNLLEGSVSGLTAAEITTRVNERGHEAKKRTVYRDLEALQAAGFPLAQDDGGDSDENASRWLLEKTARIGEYLVLTPREIVGLYLARQVLTPLRDTPFFADLEQLFGKIEDKLGTKNRDYLAEVSAEIHFEPGPAWGLGVVPEVIDGVRAACSEGHYLTCQYNSANSQTITERKLGPHYVYFSKGALYLIAEDTKDSKVKVFSLSRMQNVVMLEDAYEGERTDPEKFFGDSIGVFRGASEAENVKLSFSQTISPYIRERTWHHSQTLVMRSGGVAELSLHVTITPELVNWVLGFGPAAMVLAPEHLKEKVKLAAAKVLDHYLASQKKAG